MATIKLQTPAKLSPLTRPFTYSDLHLDLEYSYTVNNGLLQEKEIKDIVVDYDLGAIRNSIVNIFTTIPGQKILNPFFGLNLVQYLFEPCDEYTAQIIGQSIKDGITTYEPRVTLTKIRVIAQPEDSSYEITLLINVPTLSNTSFELTGTLSNSGFYINN